jgi:hypothetical protein
MKLKGDRQLNALEAEKEKGKVRRSEVEECVEAKAECSHLHLLLMQDVGRHLGLTDPKAQALPFGKKVAPLRGTATKFNAIAILRSILRTLDAHVSNNAHFAKKIR